MFYFKSEFAHNLLKISKDFSQKDFTNLVPFKVKIGISLKKRLSLTQVNINSLPHYWKVQVWFS